MALLNGAMKPPSKMFVRLSNNSDSVSVSLTFLIRHHVLIQQPQLNKFGHFQLSIGTGGHPVDGSSAIAKTGYRCLLPVGGMPCPSSGNDILINPRAEGRQLNQAEFLVG